MCIPAVAGLSQQTAPLLAPLVAQLCSLVMISHPKAPPLKLADVWMEPAKGRAKLSHQGLLMAVLVAMSQYQHLCSDNVTFWGGWEAEAWLCMAFWDATATWVQTQLLYNWCRYLLPPETQRRFFFFWTSAKNYTVGWCWLAQPATMSHVERRVLVLYKAEASCIFGTCPVPPFFFLSPPSKVYLAKM